MTRSLMVVDDDQGLAVVWNGSETFNVYDWSPALLAVDGAFKGQEVDAFMVDGWDDDASSNEVVATMHCWLDERQAQDDDDG